MNVPWYRKIFFKKRVPDLTEVRRKAELGDAEAQFALGLNCEFIADGGQREAEVAKWFRRAADQGHSLAQFNLAVMYAAGHGVPVDEAEAGRLFHLAADQGDAGAQFRMGKRCQRRSFEPSKGDASEARVEAYKWFQLAATQGYGNSETYLERSSLKLSREEFDEARRRVAAFAAAVTEG
jgi:TPR repeat protein